MLYHLQDHRGNTNTMSLRGHRSVFPTGVSKMPGGIIDIQVDLLNRIVDIKGVKNHGYAQAVHLYAHLLYRVLLSLSI